MLRHPRELFGDYWIPLRNATLGLLLLVFVKLAARFPDDGIERYKVLHKIALHHGFRSMPMPEDAKAWRPYEKLLEPNVPQDHLDYDRCALLHNRIVELGWLGHFKDSGRDPASRNKTTWWEYYSEEAENIRHRLEPAVVEFLKLAQMPEERLAFSYHLEGLASPGEMFEHLDPFRDFYDVGQNFILLYARTWTEDRFGLVFNQRDSLAIFLATTDSDPVTEHANHFSLEFTLAVYLGLIEAGKTISVPLKEIETIAEDSYHDENKVPWVMKPYGEKHLQETLTQFAHLQKAIWDRMPRKAKTEELKRRMNEPLVREEALSGIADVPKKSFLYKFLTQASGCPFRFIAPGLECPTSETIVSILREPPLPPYKVKIKVDLNYKPELKFDERPVLLFPSEERVNGDVDGSGFYLYFQAQLTGVRGGLYLNSQRLSWDEYQDGIQLITPFPVGANGFARTGDNSPIRDQPYRLYDYDGPTRDQEGYTSLFQTGFNSFVDGHHTQLMVVLMHWVELVESGLWKVGPEGVEGGMKVFKQADTEKHWWRYSVPPATP